LLRCVSGDSPGSYQSAWLWFFESYAIGFCGSARQNSENAALAAAPIIIVFLIFQKYFTQGITMGAVKG